MGFAQKKAQIEFAQASWCERAQDDFSQMPGGDEKRIQGYELGCGSGTYQLLAVMADGARVGSIIFEIVQEPVGIVVIIHGLRCEPVAGVSIADQTTLTFSQKCKAQGVVLLRCFTERAGLVRRLKNLGADVCWQAELKL